MGRKKLETRAKRNNFTLTKEAQKVIDQQINKSRFVSDAIVSYVTAPADKNKLPEPSTIEVKQKVAEPGKVKAVSGDTPMIERVRKIEPTMAELLKQNIKENKVK